jgi:archaellum component FlaC
MKPKLVILLPSALALIWCGSSVAQEKASGIPDKAEQQVEVRIDKTKVSPELRQILQLEEKAAEEMGKLAQRMESEHGDQIAEMQKEIERIKWELKIAILQLRLEIARERADTPNVEEIERTLDRLQNPTPVAEDLESKAAREAQVKEIIEK